MLAIDPSYILGRTLRNQQESRDSARCIARRLPSNLKLLILEGLLSPFPVPIHTADVEMLEVFPNEAEVLIQVLIEQEKLFTPGLKYLWVDCGQGDTEIPPRLCDMGDEYDVKLASVNGFHLFCQESPSAEWLDEA